MPVNLNLSFEIHNISEIHNQKDKIKKKEIYEAAKKFLNDEGILDQGMIVDFAGQDGYLAAYTTFPIVISRSYVWLPDVTKRWETLAYSIAGPSCRPMVNFEYPDEETEEPIEQKSVENEISEKKLEIKGGLKGVCVGMKQHEIEKVLGIGDDRSSYSGVYFINYISKGIQISYKNSGKTAKVIFFYNKDKGYEHFATYDLETFEGINWKSSREDVLKAYGKPKNEFEFEDEFGKGSRIVYPDFDFRFVNGELKRICIMSK